MIIDNYPEGSNLTILNTMYRGPMYNEETKNWENDFLMITYKDNDNNIKRTTTIYQPNYTYYLLKPQYQASKMDHFQDLYKLDPVTTKYSNILYSIAENTGNKDLYKQNIYDGNNKLNKLFFTDKRIYGADIPIKSYYRIEFAHSYQNPYIPLNIGFFDIESDSTYAVSDSVIVIGECPINCISVYFTGSKTMYTFILRNKDNKLIQEYENKVMNDFQGYIEYYRDFVKQQIGEDRLKKYNLVDTNLRMFFYNTEEELLISFWNVVKIEEPDIMTAWNMFDYDIRHIIARIEKLGLDKYSVMCKEDINPKICYLFYDVAHLNELHRRTDFIDISLNTVFLDQRIIYESRRKNNKALQSTALDFIGNIECGVRKYDYHEYTTNLSKLPYIRFDIFVLYNIIDVIVQACIDAQVGDISYVFFNVLEMNTPYDKIFRETNYHHTKAYEYYKYHDNCIIECNSNKFKNAPKEKFPGAYVAKPNKITDKPKERSHNRPIMKFNNTNDYDYKSLYPSIMKWGNIAPNTLIGKIEIDNAPYRDKPYVTTESGSSYVENLASYNYIEFCHRWLGLANIEEILDDINDYFNKYRTPMYKKEKGNLIHDDIIVPAYKVNKRNLIYRKKEIPDYIWDKVNEIRSNIPLGEVEV